MAQLAAKKSMSAAIIPRSAEFVFFAMLQIPNELLTIPDQYKRCPEVRMRSGNGGRVLRPILRLLSLAQFPDTPDSPACQHIAAPFAPNELQLRLPERFHFAHRL